MLPSSIYLSNSYSFIMIYFKCHLFSIIFLWLTFYILIETETGIATFLYWTAIIYRRLFQVNNSSHVIPVNSILLRYVCLPPLKFDSYNSSIALFGESRMRCFGWWLLPRIKNWEVSTTNWHLPLVLANYLYKVVKSCAAAAADFQHPLKGVQGGEQKWGTLLWEKLAEQVFR